MLNNRAFVVAVLAAALSSLLLATEALAQAKGGGKIVCWKDKSGKVMGCGDTVPPEYQDAATKELDKGGVTRKTTETAEERAKKAEQEKELAAQKAEERAKLAEQRRQDSALTAAFSNENEIDLKRDRDLQVVDTQLTTLRVAHKNAMERQADVKSRMDATKKTGKPATDAQKEDLARAESDAARTEKNIAAKEQEKADIRKRYAEMKQRYIQLRGGTAAAPAAPTTAAAKK